MTQQQSNNCPPEKRNRFFRGKSMGVEAFSAEQEYLLSRHRLSHRAVHGWGVVAGLALRQRVDEASKSAQPVSVGKGLAFDRHGRELLLCSEVTLSEANIFLIDSEQSGRIRALRDAPAGGYVLSAHYAERYTGDAVLPDRCGCGETEKNFVCECVIFSITALCDPKKCPCGEGPCKQDGRCGEDCCCTSGRGPHSTLCRWIEERTVIGDAARLREWKDFHVDPADGVPLACVTIEKTDDACHPVSVKSIEDACSPRRLVKNNDLLYDLIRGCDLTRIEWMSWAEWHRELNPKGMPMEKLEEFVGAELTKYPRKENPKALPTQFRIRFTGPVLSRTVTVDCFAMRCVVAHADTGWHDRREVPLMKPILAPPKEGDPPDTTREVTLAVSSYWHEEFWQTGCALRDGGIVHIEVRGDYILDCRGQPIDANANGFKPAEEETVSGNGTPGGTFLSIFRVEKSLNPPPADSDIAK